MTPKTSPIMLRRKLFPSAFALMIGCDARVGTAAACLCSNDQVEI
jgi:hypothetical protein